MKAIQAIKPEVVSLVEIERPRVTPTGVLIKVAACGICGSDIHIKHGRNPYATYPVVLGHEVAGTVVELGANVTKFAVGDRVVVEPIVCCGTCYPCRVGRRNVCEHLQVYGCHLDGGFQEYMHVEEGSLHRLPEDVNFLQGALVEPYTIVSQGIARTGVLEGDTCLVHGAGPIGLIATDLCKSMGAKVFVSEPSARRREMARRFGADAVFDPTSASIADAVMDWTNGHGANVIFDAVGMPAIVEGSIPLLSAAGRFLEFGYGFGSAQVDFNLMNKRELTVMGIRHQYLRFEPVLRDFHNHLEKVDLLRTHVFPIESFGEAFDLFEDKRSGACKVVLTLE